MARFEREPNEFIEKVVYLNRVSKTVKGGRVMKFSALMVVGDGKGKVGYGLGKAAEVPEAIRKGIEDAKKNMITINTAGTSIPHEVIGEFSAGRVMMKPAVPVLVLSQAALSVLLWKLLASRTFVLSACAPTIPQTLLLLLSRA